MLKSGTGLLLTSPTGHDHQRAHRPHPYQGVNLQLKVGDGTDPQDFRVVATADNTGGTVRLTLRHPASARYLLIGSPGGRRTASASIRRASTTF